MSKCHRALGRARLCPRHRLPRLGAGAALYARWAAELPALGQAGRLAWPPAYDSALRVLADLSGGKSSKTLCVLNLAKSICILNMGVAKSFKRWFCSVSSAPDASHQESQIFSPPTLRFRCSDFSPLGFRSLCPEPAPP